MFHATLVVAYLFHSVKSKKKGCFKDAIFFRRAKNFTFYFLLLYAQFFYRIFQQLSYDFGLSTGIFGHFYFLRVYIIFFELIFFPFLSKQGSVVMFFLHFSRVSNFLCFFIHSSAILLIFCLHIRACRDFHSLDCCFWRC